MVLDEVYFISTESTYHIYKYKIIKVRPLWELRKKQNTLFENEMLRECEKDSVVNCVMTCTEFCFSFALKKLILQTACSVPC